MTKIVRRVPAPLWLFGVILLFFNKMAFSNLILARGDVFRYFYPYWTAASVALRAGRIPFWNPQIFMGTPFLANSQVGFLYPLNWPFWLWLSTPYAISASIILHLWIAACGAYLAAKRAFGLDKVPAMLTGFTFALGGYVSAQVEHINQLQGIAWMPWLVVVLAEVAETKQTGFPSIGRSVAKIGLIFAVQLLAGHTQTAFISGVMILVWTTGLLLEKWLNHKKIEIEENDLNRTRSHFLARNHYGARYWVILGTGVLLALLLAGAQLLPTWELAQESGRQGGLNVNEVLSFSLHPALLARTLLPAIGQSLATEYVAFLPYTAWILALFAVWQWRRRAGVLPAFLLVCVGLILAMGTYNPLNWLLAQLPLFNLFRVPARWLLLLAFGLSLLAGCGWQIAWERWQVRGSLYRNDGEWWNPLIGAIALLLLFVLWNWGAKLLVQRLPTGPEAPYAAAQPLSVLVWFLELLWFSVVSGFFTNRLQRSDSWLSPALLLPVLIVLQFWGTRTHPYQQLTTPEAYFDLRGPIARLQALTANDIAQARYLSKSDIFFDVGDQAEIDAIYADQLSIQAQYDYTVAIKLKEVIDANLSMTYGLTSLDGFDGGILPLAAYTQFSALLLGENGVTTDGRLREFLDVLPADQWLDLTNTRYLITDKTGDVWRQIAPDLAIFFDLQHPLRLAEGGMAPIDAAIDFEATAVYMLSVGSGTLSLESADGAQFTLLPVEIEPGLLRFDLPEEQLGNEPKGMREIFVQAGAEPWQISAITLVNNTDHTFYPLVLGQYRLLYSGDVKIYENLDVLPRVFMVGQWLGVRDNAAGIEAMKQPDFNVRETAVILGENGGAPGSTAATALLRRYSPEQIYVRTSGGVPALLVLTDATYPGWQVAIDGLPAELQTVDLIFRGVIVPAGSHEVVFTFRSTGWRAGLMLSAAGVLILILLLTISKRR